MCILDIIKDYKILSEVVVNHKTVANFTTHNSLNSIRYAPSREYLTIILVLLLHMPCMNFITVRCLLSDMPLSIQCPKVPCFQQQGKAGSYLSGPWRNTLACLHLTVDFLRCSLIARVKAFVWTVLVDYWFKSYKFETSHLFGKLVSCFITCSGATWGVQSHTYVEKIP